MVKRKTSGYFLVLVLLLLHASLIQARNAREKEWVTPVSGLENNEITLMQITDTEGGNNFQASISADGSRIAFASNRDLTTGGNPDGNYEIFLWLEEIADFIQITDSVGGDGGNPANFEPRISADGYSIVFSSNRDLTGDNPDMNREIFLWQEGADITQITNTVGGGDNANRLPSLNGDGTRIALVSNRNLTGTTPDSTHQIFRARVESSIEFDRITDSTGGGDFANSEPSINLDGTRIAFSSNRNLTGGNPRQNREIFLWNGANRQITPAPPIGANGNRDNIQPSLNGDGRKIAFSSNRNNLTGMPHNNHEIFLWMEPNTFRRITTSQGGDISPNFAANANPSINPSGDSIAFTSNRDLMGGDGDGNREIFLWRANGAGRIIQITMSDCRPTTPMTPPTCPGDDDNRSPSISENGRRVAFDSNRDLLGIYSDRGKGRSGPVVIFHHDASHDIFIGDLSSPD
jgi:Tol biopolymer transport system component